METTNMDRVGHLIARLDLASKLHNSTQWHISRGRGWSVQVFLPNISHGDVLNLETDDGDKFGVTKVAGDTIDEALEAAIDRLDRIGRDLAGKWEVSA